MLPPFDRNPCLATDARVRTHAGRVAKVEKLTPTAKRVGKVDNKSRAGVLGA